MKGLVGHDKGKTLDTIVKTLNDIGYTVDFEVLNSKFFGVPQNRERIFIIAVRDDLVSTSPWDTKGSTVVPKGKRRISGYEGEDSWELKTFNFDWPRNNEVTTRLRDVLETQVDEKYYLDDERTAKLVAKLSEENQQRFNEVDEKRIVQLNGNRDNPGLSTNKGEAYTIPANPMSDRGQLLQEPSGLPIREATKKGFAVAEEGDSVNFRFPESATRRGRVGKQLANTLEATGINQGVVESHEVRPVLTPERAEKRQNGRRFKEDGEESFTLTSQDRHGVALGVNPRYRIRKLTPKECFRLQAFPDEAHQALVDAGISDSQRYKMAGNAATVNVIKAIGKQLIPYLT